MEPRTSVIRQGDLLFIPIHSDELPPDIKKRESGTIAEGEATGHAHKITSLEDAEVFEVAGWQHTQIFVRVGSKGVSIVHEEHKAVVLEPRTAYKVHRAREYDYLSNLTRAVRD
jgi:hypothetical protein